MSESKVFDGEGCIPLSGKDVHEGDPSKKMLELRAETIRKAKERRLTLVGTKDAAEIIGVCKRTLDGWRAKSEGPPWHRVGKKKVVYAIEDLHAWIEATKS